MKKIPQAIIFDMDGTLVDSEPLWFEAERKVFAKVGIDLDKTMVLQTRGLREDEVVDYWYEKYKWNNLSKEEVMDDVLNNVIDLMKERSDLLPGARDTVALAYSLGCKVALASSSHINVINTFLKKFNFDKFDCVYSAENELKGKPDPAVYLTTCRKLNVEAKNCLAFEDSVNGLRSAKAAGMFCIAIPAQEEKNDERFKIADRIINSLEEVNENLILNIFNK
jgi:sugar-phosphatase